MVKQLVTPILSLNLMKKLGGSHPSLGEMQLFSGSMILNNKQFEKQIFEAVLSEIRKRIRKNNNS